MSALVGGGLIEHRLDRHPRHPQPTDLTPDPVRRVHELNHVLPHRQIAPPALRAPGPCHAPRREPAPQVPLAETVEMHGQFARALILLDLGDSMGFQSQRFPNKRFHAHRPLASLSRAWQPEQDTPGCPIRTVFQHLAACDTFRHVTLFGERQLLPSFESMPGLAFSSTYT